MKNKILGLIVLAIAVLCFHLYAGDAKTNAITVRSYGVTNVFPFPAITNIVMESGKMYVEHDAGTIKLLVSDVGRTNLVNALVATGEFCRVRGHAWGHHVHVTLEYQDGKIGCRECKACKKHETQYADWK